MSKRIERRQERERREESVYRLPAPGSALPQIVLIERRPGHHPWIFRRMLEEPKQRVIPGALVECVTRDGRRVGCGYYNANSEITLRLLSEDPRVVPDGEWFARRIADAVAFRHDVLKLPETTDAYRVIHSEGDGLSGLVVDRLANVLVLELYSAGPFRHLPWIQAGLRACFPDAEQVVRADARSEKYEGVAMDGPPPSENACELTVREGAARFHVDLRKGHKTGFFADQREHRARLAELSRGHELFDGCCYSGGFAIQAALAGAKRVEAVDLDEKAIAVAESNGKLNAVTDRVTFAHGNVFNVLREHRAARKRFARMVLDPPKLAVSKSELPKALQSYKDMNRQGMQCVEAGGVLLSCSCTGLVSELDLIGVLRDAASEARADLQIFGVGGASPDHPWAARMPEGRYLKVIYSRVRPLG